MKIPRKLIEVALPLEAINTASAREKSIRHGHPSTLHLWWARRPLAAARAVIFAQMVDDPSTYVSTLRSDQKLKRKAESVLKERLKLWHETQATARNAAGTDGATAEPGPEPTLDAILADLERQRLFAIIEDLVQWENTTNETVLQAAREEIWASWRRACAENADHPRAKELFDRKKLPAFHDPFAGGGALPLEAQRLGLESYASDLNPVAVLINKAMIEIPPKFAGRAPVNPAARKEKTLLAREWRGAQGLAEDVRYYGQWMRDEAEKRIGVLYPKVAVTAEMAKERPDLKPYVGQELTVIAWLWARTVRSPNPAFAQVDVPLASTFMLSTKTGKEAYVEPVIENGGYRFTVKVGKPKDAERAKSGTKSGGSHSAFLCLMSGTPMPFEYLREEARAKRMGSRLMAIVAEGTRGRVYLSPTAEHEAAARKAKPEWKPEVEICHWPGRTNVVEYGLTRFGDLFTPRQLVALATFSDLVQEARARVQHDALRAGLPDDPKPLRDGGTGAASYVEAVGVYLGLAVSRSSSMWSSNCWWQSNGEFIAQVFTRQAIPMVWDFGEVNVFSDATGNWSSALAWITRVQEALPADPSGYVSQLDAARQSISSGKVVSSDPPYYDNIGYADLSDFYYVWQRRSMSWAFPDQFATLAVPKAEELVATPYRHGSKEKAETFFLDGMTQAMHCLSEQSHAAFPVTIYYAFKQSETETAEGTASTGWETFLDAVIRAGFGISGTWPMRTERPTGVKVSVNALASSIVLVCRKRSATAPTATRREFVAALKAELPVALGDLQRGNIAPVDLAQAAIGPGMAVYTRFAQVLDAQGKALSVREALALINETLDEALASQEGDFDADSRWALTWFDQHGFDEGEYGTAEQLSKSKNTSVAGMVEAGIVESKRGKVRLYRPEELPADWDPATDPRLRRRKRRRCAGRQARRQGRGGPRTGLPPLHRLRAQEAQQRGARLQRPGAEFPRNHADRERRQHYPTRNERAVRSTGGISNGTFKSGPRRQGHGTPQGRPRALCCPRVRQHVSRQRRAGSATFHARRSNRRQEAHCGLGRLCPSQAGLGVMEPGLRQSPRPCGALACSGTPRLAQQVGSSGGLLHR
jgi:putative DNA methylase